MYFTPSVIEASQQSSSEGYVMVAVFTAWSWDLILSLFEDVQVFTGRKFRPYDLIYILSRIATAGVLATSLGFLVDSGTGCAHILVAVTWFETVCVIANSSLFLLRVLAVFTDSSRMTKAVFIILWSTTLLALTGPFSAKVNLGALGCNIGQVKPISSLGFVAITVFDTTVFVAISVKVLQINSDWRTPKRSWVVSFIHGHGLTQVSNVLLRSGQYYYLATVGFSVFTLIALLSPASAFSPTFRAGFTFVSLAVLNMMACRVFRLLRLGALPNDLSTLRLPTIEFAHDEGSNIVYTEVSQRSEGDEEQLASGLV